MHRVTDIGAVAITLKLGSERTLFVLLSSDGMVNRMGNGSTQPTDRDLYIGRTLEPLLPALLTHLTDDVLRLTGIYDDSDKRGTPCRLSIALKFLDGADDGFDFSYGSDSLGPPDDISSFVQAAVAITEPWYTKQQAMVKDAERSTTKPWWKFW